MFFKKCVLKNFTILKGKHLCWSLFNNVAGLKSCNIILVRLFYKILKISFFMRYLQWLILFRYVILKNNCRVAALWKVIQGQCFLSSHRTYSVAKVVLRNFAKFTGEHLCQNLFFNKVADLQLYQKETLAQVFSCDFCEVSKNMFLTEHLRRLLFKSDRSFCAILT